MNIQRYKGTRDYYPEDKIVQNRIFDVWRKVAGSMGYSEIDGPILEPIELYKKSGEEVPKQMYTLTDKSGRRLALRPETTPTIARMVAQNRSLQMPLKWYSISRCLRYEATQQGRDREFFQFNLDMLGSDSIQADAEVIATIVWIMLSFKLTRNDFYIRVSNRKVVQIMLEELGIKDQTLKEVYRIIDKKEKVPDFKRELEKCRLNKKQISGITRMLNIKDIAKIRVEDKALAELKELFRFLKAYGVGRYCELDLSIMRGFDYYTSTVFEMFDRKREFRAIAGGGRYENLVGIFGGERCPGVGYGMGYPVLEIFLRKKKRLPCAKNGVDYYVAPVNERVRDRAIGIAVRLSEKFAVDIDATGRGLRKQLEYANTIGARKVVIVGEKDLRNGKVTVRDMNTGKESAISIKNL